MKAIVYRQHGEPRDVLSYEEVSALAAPGLDEVKVRVTSRMVHPIDSMMVRGIIPMPIGPNGSIPGGDGVGIVEEVGAGVDPKSGIIPGKRVIIFHAHGTWAQHMIAPAQTLIPIPDDISDTTASQISINGITAIMLMRIALASNVKAGSEAPILVTAAGSSVGRNLIALAKRRHMKVIALVRSDEGAGALALEVAGVKVISTQRSDWADEVIKAYDNAPSVAMDPISGEMTSRLLGLLADGGTLIMYGSLDHRPPTIPTNDMIIRQLSLTGVTAPAWLSSTSAEQRVIDIEELFEMARRSPKNFSNFQQFALKEVADALAAAEVTPRRGAVILSS